MQNASDRAALSWLKPEFARILAILWVAGLALIYVIRYEAWLLPLQLSGLVSASIPALHIGPHFREFWMARGRDFLCVTALLVAATGIGAVVINGLIQRRDLFALLFAVSAGLWALAVLILILGAVSISLVPCAFLAILSWGLPAPRKLVRDFLISSEKIDGWAKLMILCIAAAAVLNLPGAFAPPFEYDELEYHLGALADYQRAGHITFLPHNFYSNLPQLTEMLYLLATTAASDIAAKLLHWCFGVLSALAVYAVARRLWSRNLALTAAALFYCTPFVQDLSQTARIDLATTFFATLAFGALVVWSDDLNTENWIWLSAACAGAAVATKWTAIPVVVLPAMVFISVIRKSFRLTVAFGFLSLVFVVPWLVKNWWLAGNPIYPLFSEWFPHPYWSAEQAAIFAGRHYPTFGWDSVSKFFSLLWDVSFTEAGAVPLLLMTAPLLLLVRRPEATAKRVGLLSLSIYVSWFCFTFRPWRFLFPSFGMAALTGAYAVEKCGRDSGLRKVIRASVGVVLGLSLVTMALSNFMDQENWKRLEPQVSFVRYLLGQFPRDELVARIGNGVLEPIIWMNEHLPQNAKVIYVGEARAYYAKQPVLWSTALDQHTLTLMSRGVTSSQELLGRLRSRGITHVYMNGPELARLQKGYRYMADANWDLINDLLQNHAREIHNRGNRIVYSLTE